jgi:hypothetical protein
MNCIHPFHSSVCSRPNSTIRGTVVALPPFAVEVDARTLVVLAFHVQVANDPRSKSELTNQNVGGV